MAVTPRPTPRTNARPARASATATTRDAMAVPRPGELDPKAPGYNFVEFGASGLKQFSGYVREEWMPELSGRRGIEKIREMRDNDPIVGAFFFGIEMLLRTVSFYFKPASKSPEDRKAADFANSCMGDMENPWANVLTEILTFLEYGWDVHEIVYKKRSGMSDDPDLNSAYNDGMIGWRKFAQRAQATLLHWEFDAAGNAVAMVQMLPTGGPLLRVPLAKALHFRTTTKKNNPEGRTLLRNVYTSYYKKKRIEDVEWIGVERDLTGIAVAWVPPKLLKADAIAEDKKTLKYVRDMVQNTSRNEQEGFVLPLEYTEAGEPMFKFELLSTGGRRQFDTTGIVSRYDHRIASTVLADFITLGGGERGSYALSRNKTDMFAIAVVGFLDMICAEFNQHGLPDLLALNGLKGKVKLEHGDIARRDLTELSQFVGQLGIAGFLTPDAVLEDHLRDEAGLPSGTGEGEPDPATQSVGDKPGAGNLPAVPRPIPQPGNPAARRLNGSAALAHQIPQPRATT